MSNNADSLKHNFKSMNPVAVGSLYTNVIGGLLKLQGWFINVCPHLLMLFMNIIVYMIVHNCVFGTHVDNYIHSSTTKSAQNE